MTDAEVRAHVTHWVESTLSVPSPLFNNLPPCPYSRESLLRNTVDIRCVDGAAVIDTLVAIGNGWDDRFEIILLACEPRSIAPDALISAVEGLRAWSEAADLVVFFDHPDNTNPKYRVTSANGKYVMVGIQRLSLFLKAAKPLVKHQYFERTRKQYLVDDQLKSIVQP
jgi:hypothetical protein